MADEFHMTNDSAKRVDPSPFNLFRELREWATELEEWERLALRLIVANGNLDANEIDVVFQRFLIDKGLAPRPEECDLHQIDLDSIPRPAEAERKVMLTEIKHLQGVNALVEGHPIGIGKHLTVIYGPTGSGKSGYARILKDSCFTRSKDKNILGNIRLERDKMPVPKAVFIVQDGDEDKTIKWQPGTPCPLLRDYFAVFDTSCTRVNIDEENVFVTPYGFDVFPTLVEVARNIRELLEKAIENQMPDTEALVPKEGTSRISVLLSNLSKDTPVEELEKLAVFGEVEKGRLKTVRKEIADLKTTDPAKALQELSNLRKDLIHIQGKCECVFTALGKDAADSVRISQSELAKLRELAAAASAAQFAREPVQPVGSPAWLELIRAALTFHAEAYPDSSFPADIEDAKCVLCQQPLCAEARDRLQRFWKYVTSDVRQKAELKEAELNSKHNKIRELGLDFFDSETACRRSIEADCPELTREIDIFVEKAVARRRGLLAAATEADWGHIQAMPEGIKTRLSEKVSSLDKALVKLKEADRSLEISRLEKQVQLLVHREYLDTIIDKVRKVIEDLRWIAAANRARESVTTHHITYKQKALLNLLIAKNFEPELLRECESLGFRMPLTVKTSGVGGETIRKLSLGGPSSPETPSTVLSEGEQRAVAIADFLTEVKMAGNISGLVFDDPVCSVDHERKERIAERLVEEARQRQVIIFTHDVLFTHYLAEAAEAKGVPFKAHTVSRGNMDQTPGYVNAIVFPHEHYEKKASQRARELLQAARSATGQQQEDNLRMGCSYLRAAYEDFVQRKLFGDVVGRWRENIKYTLTDVFFDEETAKQAQEHMEYLSRYVEAHSHSAALQETPISVSILAHEIEEYGRVMKEYKEKRKQWEDSRTHKVFT